MKTPFKWACIGLEASARITNKIMKSTLNIILIYIYIYIYYVCIYIYIYTERERERERDYRYMCVYIYIYIYRCVYVCRAASIEDV